MVGGGRMEIQSSIMDDRLEVIFPIKIEESIEYTIIEKTTGRTVDAGIPIFRDTFTTWGKEQVARLVGEVGSQYPIDEVRARVSGAWNTVAATSIAVVNGSLRVESGTFTTSGTYDVVAGGSSLYAGANHNEISTSVPLSSGQELVFTIYYGFSGLNYGGNTITAGRLGGVSGYYPVNTVGVDFNGTLTTKNASKSIFSNTLRLTCTEFTSSGTYDSFSAITSNPIGEEYYHMFSGHTIVLQANQELKPYLYFVYG